MNEDVFLRYSAYYDLLYRDKDYHAEADYVVRALRSTDSFVQTVLEFGSGTGRHGRILAQHGFDLLGVERSESMVAAAQRAAVPSTQSCRGSFRCMTGDIKTVALGHVFDAVISLFHVVSYQTRNSDLVETFANAARHLNVGGIFLFDVWHGPAVLHERPSVRVKRIEDDSILLTRIAEPALDVNTGVVSVRYTMLAESKAGSHLTTFREEHRMRYLFPTEIEFLAGRTGFELERSEEFLTCKIPSESTWGVAYLLRKRSASNQ
jgi:SAM-dependent methyltransferase